MISNLHQGRLLSIGKNINEMVFDFLNSQFSDFFYVIATRFRNWFCPQFDWLVYDLSVSETLHLFGRLKGVSEPEYRKCVRIL